MKNGQHVVPNKGGWDLKRSGSTRATIHTRTQAEAIARGKVVAANQKTELLIHGRDGKVRQKNSYGNDPFPPRG